MKVELYNDGDLVKVIEFELGRSLVKGDYIQLQDYLYCVESVCYVIGKLDRIEKIVVETSLENRYV